MFSSEVANEFLEDVLSLVTEEPRLVNDIVKSLRGGVNYVYKVPSGRRWHNIRAERVECILREFGCFLCSREHGAGTAHYVATVPFSEVDGRRGRKLPVKAY